ncbi:hypothetical protein [Pseudonocardia aurantiaca]|uniref:Uncharacterized protein n=1 Tax=Pseudonocardia aurantiaca TaxID=75290 RepID=A0ABW4FPK4_9PSEU
MTLKAGFQARRRPRPPRFGAVRGRVAVAVTESAPSGQENEEDRVVSRRIDNPTQAGPADERAYRAADRTPEAEAGDPPGDSPGDTSEPTRSE